MQMSPSTDPQAGEPLHLAYGMIHTVCLFENLWKETFAHVPLWPCRAENHSQRLQAPWGNTVACGCLGCQGNTVHRWLWSCAWKVVKQLSMNRTTAVGVEVILDMARIILYVHGCHVTR